jgi:branched-chain amino acid transport system permease protein
VIRSINRAGTTAPWALAAAAAVIVAVTANDYILTVAIVAVLSAIMAVGLNFLMGYAGLINLGIGAFYALGAYGGAKLSVGGTVPAAAILVIMPLAAFAIGLLVGIPILRTRGLHFAVATLGIGLIISDVANNWISVTGGPIGIAGIERPSGLGVLDLAQNRDFFILCVLVLAVVMAFATWYHRSRVARVLVATRDDDLLTRSLGFAVTPYKLVAFALSAAAAALAGVLYAWFIQYISPPPFTFFAISFPVFVLVAVGGPGSLWGPVVGAAFLNGLPEALSVEPRTKLIIYGAVLLATVVFLPRGLAPETTRLVRRLVGGRRTSASASGAGDAITPAVEPPRAAAGLHTESQGAVR